MDYSHLINDDTIESVTTIEAIAVLLQSVRNNPLKHIFLRILLVLITLLDSSVLSI